MQKSVFEVSVKNKQQLDKIKQELIIISEDDDNIRFYKICSVCRQSSQTLNGEHIAYFPAVVIV